MEFNSSKCQVIQVARSRKPIHVIYRLHGKVLETVTCAKYLRIEISSSLSWKSHVGSPIVQTKPWVLLKETFKEKCQL